MATADRDIAHLLALLDAGDDSALVPLADALEEAGDERTAGLRQISLHAPTDRRAKYHGQPTRMYGWLPKDGMRLPDVDYRDTAPLHVDGPIVSRLGLASCGRGRVYPGLPDGFWYTTRHDAFLALAAALIAE